MKSSIVTELFLQEIRVRARVARSTEELLAVIADALRRVNVGATEVSLADWKRLLVVGLHASNFK